MSTVEEQPQYQDGESSLLPKTGSNNNLPSTAFETPPSVTRDALEQFLSPEHNRSIKGKPSGAEKDLFIVQCLTKGMNPLIGDVHVFSDANGKLNFIVSESFYLRVADAHPKFRGIRSGIIVERDGSPVEIEGGYSTKGEEVVGGWAEIHRSDRDFPIVHKVNFRDYDKKNGTWKQFPGRMIEKVAQVGGLRQAFPSQFGGLYSSDEMPDEGTEDSKTKAKAKPKGHSVAKAKDLGAKVEEPEEQNTEPIFEQPPEITATVQNTGALPETTALPEAGTETEPEPDPDFDLERDRLSHPDHPDKLFFPSAKCLDHDTYWTLQDGQYGPWWSCKTLVTSQEDSPTGKAIWCNAFKTVNDGKPVEIVDRGSA